jgi:hypothetical protein
MKPKKTCGPNMAIAVKMLGLAGNPFFLKMGAGPLKKGAMTPLSRKKEVPAKKIIPKCTEQVFLRYWFSKYSGEEVSFSLQSTALLKGTKDRPTPPILASQQKEKCEKISNY